VCRFLSPVFARGITCPLAGFQWRCCTNVADIPRPGIPSVHEHESNGRSTGRYVSLTHSASSFTRALVKTSVICDAFMIRQFKSVNNKEVARTNMIYILVGGAEDAFLGHSTFSVCCRDRSKQRIKRDELLGTVVCSVYRH
jgi:hypothetical protein